MPSTRGIHASAYALVHATASSPRERERHTAFLAHMLPLAFLALAVAPLFLAFHGAPSPAESLLFALSLAPAGAAILVVRSGHLVLGHLVASVGLVGVALVVFAGLRAGLGVAIIWLVAAQLEAVASRDRRLARCGALIVGTALLAVVALSLDTRFAPTASCACTALLAGLGALVAGLPMSHLTASIADAAAEPRRHDIDAALDAELVTHDCPSQAPLRVVEPAANEAPSLAAMSHDLRMPLNAIIGFSDILASRTTRPDDVAKQCELARTINRSGRHLLATLDAVLDPSRSASPAGPAASPTQATYPATLVKDAA